MELSRHGLLGFSEFPPRILQLPGKNTFDSHSLNFSPNAFIIQKTIEARSAVVKDPFAQSCSHQRPLSCLLLLPSSQLQVLFRRLSRLLYETIRPQPLIAVTDVEASSRWYQRLLGCESAHGGPEYERLVSNGELILQLHNWHVEDHHGLVGDPDAKPYGNGVLLWFETDDFDAAIARATDMGAEVVKPPHRNPPSGDGGPNHRECWFRDLDGYVVVLASPDGEAG